MRSSLLFFVLLSACPKTELPLNSPPTNGPATAPATVPVITSSTPTATHGTCAASCELSTNEKVGQVYKQLTGESLEPVPKCVSRPDSLPRAIAVGTFLSDRGCRLEGVFVDCCYSVAKQPDALLDLGWASMNSSQRQTLAAQFARGIILAFEAPLSSATEDFGVLVNGKMTPTFTPLTATVTPDGGVRIEYWRKIPPGMVKPTANEYSQRQLAFDAKGAITGPTELTSFSGPRFTSKLNP